MKAISQNNGGIHIVSCYQQFRNITLSFFKYTVDMKGCTNVSFSISFP